MAGKSIVRIGMPMLLVAVVGLLSARAASPVIGSVAGSKNATVGGLQLRPNTLLASGDQLQVNDGVAVVAMERGSRMVFGRETVASFERGKGGVTVLLGQGNVSLYHPATGFGMRVKVGELAVEPAAGYATLGEVALSGATLVVRAQEGALRIEGKGPAMQVVKGKTITLPVHVSAAPQHSLAPAGKASGSHMTQEELFAIAGLAAGGTAAGLSIAAKNRANDANQAALQAAMDATAAAAAAASAAAAAALAACLAAHPAGPCP